MKKWFLFSMLFIFLLYLLTLRGSYGNINLYRLSKIERKNLKELPFFNNSQESARFALINSIVEKKTFIVDGIEDFLEPDLAWYNGHFLSAFPIGVSLLASIGYLIGKNINMAQLGSYFTITLISLINLYLLELICEKFNLINKTRLIVLFTTAIASVYWIYSVGLYAHIVSVLLLLIMSYFSIKIRKNHNNFLPLSFIWFVYGLNLFVDYPNLLISFPIILFAILRTIVVVKEKDTLKLKLPSEIFFSFFPIIIILGIFVYFNISLYNKPIVFTNTYNLHRLKIQNINFSYEKLSNDLFSKKSYSSRFSLSNLKRGLWVLLFSPDRGLFVFSPIFLFIFIGFYFAYKKKNYPAYIIIFIFVLNLFIYSVFDDPWGGWSFGPRYLTISLPLLSILIGFAWQEFIRKKFFLRLLMLILFLYSAGISFLSALTTTAIPPSIEAINLNLNPTIFYNLNYLNSGKVSSFFYNLIKSIISPQQYYLLIFSVIIIVSLILFIPEDRL
jgi:hypothetical protein